MKFLFVFALCLSITGLTSAQVQSPLKKVDSVAQMVLTFFKKKEPDSVYALTGKSFREKITVENFSAIVKDKIFPLTDFENVKYIRTMQGINKYRLEGKTAPLQLLIGLDVDEKIKTLLVQPYVED